MGIVGGDRAIDITISPADNTGPALLTMPAMEGSLLE